LIYLIYQSFSEVGNSEFLVLLENLEKKINSKFEKQEDTNEKILDDLNKFKTDIENLKPQVDKNSKNIGHIFEQIEIIFGRLNDLKALISNNNDLMSSDMNDKLEKLKKYLNEKLEE